MRYMQVTPHEALRRHVACFWTLQGHVPAAGAAGGASSAPGISPTQDSIETILPDGRPELIFHLGTPFRRIEPGGRIVRQAASLVAGQIDRPLHLLPDGHVHVMGVRFTPDGARAMLAVPMGELAGLTLDLADIWGPAADALRANLQEEAGRTREGHVGAVRLLERALLERLSRSRVGEDASVRCALHAIESDPGARVRALAVACGLSERGLERRFAAQVGLSPRTFARIARFRKALAALPGAPHGGWAHVAIACGYYDQAHMNRDFRRFAGASPGAWLRQDHPLADHFGA